MCAAPRPELRSRVASLAVVAQLGGEQSVLPSTNAVLGIQLRGRVSAGGAPLALAGITGIQSAARRYRYAAGTRSVLVRFTPQGATCLAGASDALAGTSVALADVLSPARVAELTERIAEPALTDAGALALVEELLLDLPFTPDPLVDHALARLDTESARDDATIAALARELGLGERQLERRFLRRVGISPKRYAVLRRFERAVAALGRGHALTEVALDAGYYDQAHFNRDARRFAGVPPGRLVAAARDVGSVQSAPAAARQARGRRHP